MAMKKKRPKIRFKGFEGEWAFYAFRYLFTEKRDKTQEEFEDQLLSCAIDGIYLNSELFNHFRGSTTIGYLKVKKNDLILSAQNLHLGNANVNLRFASGIISPAYKVYAINGDNPYFINAWVKSEHAKSLFMSATTEGASLCRKNIEWEFLYDKKVCIPSISEQEKIGAFLMTLDKLIEKFEVKLDKLRKLKQALLKNMFVDALSGQSVPQIRFKGYTDKWEVKELREVFEMPTASISVSELQADQYISTEHMLQNFEGIEPASSLPVYLSACRFFQDDILMANIRPYLNKIWLSDRNGGASSDVIIFRQKGNSNPAFLYYELTDGRFIRYVMKSIQGSKMPRGNKQAMQSFEMSIAPKLEQTEIARMFHSFDQGLVRTKTKLTKLRRIKQSLLEKMFV
jgi:hypothetical protein